MLIIAIDPGKVGGVGIMNTEINSLSVFMMPTMSVKDKQIVDGYGLFQLLKPYAETFYGNIHGIVEHQQAMSRFDKVKKVMVAQGAVSNFTLGRAFEAAELVVRILGIPLEPNVTPKQWQKYFGISGENTKKQSAECASRLFPGVEFCTPRGRVLDGLSDAALMAEYCRRRLMGKDNAKDSGDRRSTKPQENKVPITRRRKRIIGR